MFPKVSPRGRFALVNVSCLLLGIAIGFSVNLRTARFLTTPTAQPTYLTTLPPYVIEPPDVVRLDITSDASHAAVTGEYLVTPDGTVNLGFLGQVSLAGKTIAEAQEAIQSAAAKKLTSPRVNVDIYGYNSKVCYIVEQGRDKRDYVTRMPITGNETALDGIAQIGGLESSESTRVWISRPSVDGVGAEKILRIDWDNIARGASPTTNYQLLPGDRLFVAHDSAAMKSH